jgi:hypothetical protein
MRRDSKKGQKASELVMITENPYAVLGVPSEATPEEIKQRFRFLSHAFHPDKFASESQRRTAEEEFKRIAAAHQLLSDPVKRSLYDASRASAGRPAGRPRTQRRNPGSRRNITGSEGNYISRWSLCRLRARRWILFSLVWCVVSLPALEILLSGPGWWAGLISLVLFAPHPIMASLAVYYLVTEKPVMVHRRIPNPNAEFRDML